MPNPLRFEGFYSRFAGKVVAEDRAKAHPALSGNAGVARVVARAAAAEIDDGRVSGEAEFRALFRELSTWYGGPTSTATTMAVPAGGALDQAIEALQAVATPLPSRATLRRGSIGPAVRQLQAALAQRGYDVGPLDGVFGPATEAEVRQFQRDHGLLRDGIAGRETLDALLGVAPAAPAPAAPRASSLGRRLDQYFASTAGYASVQRAVRRFYPPDRDNGCVAYLSEALRQVGVAIPHRADASGESISLVTKPFSRYLEDRLRWPRVSRMSDLQPGDVCFSKDNPRWPGYPAHVYLFHGWHDKARQIAYVVDNQDNVHLRNLGVDDFGNFNFTPFAYALRPA